MIWKFLNIIAHKNKSVPNINISENNIVGGQYSKLSIHIDKIKSVLEKTFDDTFDFKLKEISISNKRILIAYIEGLVDKQMLNNFIIRPIIEFKKNSNDISQEMNLSNYLKSDILTISNINETNKFYETINFILSGNTVIYSDSNEYALSIGTQGWEKRGVEDPNTETAVRGPREGFTETLNTNIGLLRRKVKNTQLKFELIKIGKQTNTDICISYIKGLADVNVINTVKQRLKNIDTDAILESGYIEQFIEDQPTSLFPTIGNSEKPDIVAAKILEGRVAILCDGTPFVLTVPYLWIESLQVSEDYYDRPYFSSFTRIIRLLALIVTLTLPATYVALSTFHVKVLPFELLLSMAASTEGVPLPPFFESIAMLIVFEFLREAGIRMPKPAGQAVSIVGALVIGESAVRAGLVSSPMVIIVSLTAICSFIVPPANGYVALLRLVLLVGANILGFMGMFIILMAVIFHLCSLESFGTPYLSPIAPFIKNDMKDWLIRARLRKMGTRPFSIIGGESKPNKYRMDMNNKIKEDQNNEED